ncbi:MAG: 3-oxoacyl-ACP reductase [Legionellales bacterium]|nr:3-oxoacyl-ACP reductase [Legionellales bacterium]
MSLEGKIAWVTGASRGIGAQIADTLAASGATVIGTATSDSGAQKISDRFEAKSLAGRGMVLDISNRSEMDTSFQKMFDVYGTPDILVNNAGITRDNLMLRLKPEDWDAVLLTNLTGVFDLTKRVLKPMLKAKGGRIINISSVVGLRGNAGQTNYAAAKAGLIGFSKSLALEVASRGITVNVVAPGFIATDMTQGNDGLNEAQTQALLSTIPMGKMGSPEDIAAAVAFLASDSAQYITGETLHVNGGMLMN